MGCTSALTSAGQPRHMRVAVCLHMQTNGLLYLIPTPTLIVHHFTLLLFLFSPGLTVGGMGFIPESLLMMMMIRPTVMTTIEHQLYILPNIMSHELQCLS